MKNSAVSFISLGIVIGTAFSIMLVLIFFLSKTPFETIHWFFAGPFINRYYFGNMLNSAIPLILTGLGFSIAYRSSMFNLGGEGQVYAGGIAATAFCLLVPGFPGLPGKITALVLSFAAGGIISGFSGFFRMKWKTDELITSFLLSRALLHVIDFIITGLLNDPESNLMTTKKIGEQFFFMKIYPPSNLDTGIFFSIITGVLAYLYLFRTRQGYELRICGLNREFAVYGGIDSGKYILLPMILSGGLHGLAGAFSILGTHHMCLKGFSSGLGWSGIAVALIGRSHPLAVIPAAFFISFLESGANSAMINSDISLEIVSVVQSVVFFLITSKVIYNKIKYRRSWK